MIHPKPSAHQGPRMSRSRQAGFGLVELMVSMLLGLILIGGILSIFLSNQQAFRSNEGLARLQENARISFELMAREIREAGGNPCGAKVVSNVVNTSTTTWSLNWDAGTVIGADNTQTITAVVTGTSSSNRRTNTDAIQVMTGSLGESVALTSNITATAALTVATSSHSITATDVVMACDSTSAAIAQVTSVVGTSLFHISTGTTSPGNCSQGLGAPVSCASATGTAKTFQAGGFVAPLTSVVWYVGTNSRGGSSLFRASRGPDVSVTREEIAEGVTDMQIEYLLRDEATGNLDASWVGASSVTAWTPSTAKQVVAVRVTLDLESLSKVGTNQATLKRQQIFVVNLRNRVI